MFCLLSYSLLTENLHYFITSMIDKGKYASHGAFIKRLTTSSLAQWNKPKLGRHLDYSAVIQPLPSSKPRTVESNDQANDLKVNSKTFSAKFRFQQNIDRKPVSQQFVQPFLYIEKIIKKHKIHKKTAKSKEKDAFNLISNDKDDIQKRNQTQPAQIKKSQKSKRTAQHSLKPFITSSTVNVSRKAPAVTLQNLPGGFINLYDFQEQKRVIAAKLFNKLMENEVHNLKDMFLLWNGKIKKANPQIEVKKHQFIQFFKQILPNKISEKQLKHFFELYTYKPGPKIASKETAQNKPKQTNSQISIQALSFNYQKYRRKQTEVANIMSQKAVKERYISIKNYLIDFDNNYPGLKAAMNSIKNYQESLKTHFTDLFNSYRNPYEYEIQNLNRQLQKPIIKYDKFKKQQLTAKVQEYTTKNNQIYNKLSFDFQNFMNNYEQAIIINHDLFFTKSTIRKLLLPLMNDYPYLTRDIIQKRIIQEQAKKQEYLECISDFVVQIDKDKKCLAEDCFTLDQIVQMILMKNKSKKGTVKYSDQFLLRAVKKLIKEIKKQFLVKFQLNVSSFDQFPSDQQINMEMLHVCFEMECTKVLFKNQIWNELLNLIPKQTEFKSKFHQTTIDSNICLEFVRRYFSKLDERMKVQLSKSKQISLLAQNVSLQDFSMCSNIIEGVISNIKEYVQDSDQNEQADKVVPLNQRKKVSFAQIVDNALSRNNFPQLHKTEEDLQKERQHNIVKQLIKFIHEEEDPKKKKAQLQKQYLQRLESKLKAQNKETITDNLHDMNTLAKSFFEQEGLNTNSFDIRYFQKLRAEEEKNRSIQPQVVRMGSSLLLSNLPHVDELKSDDPLRISRYLMTNIDNGVKEERRTIKQHEYDSNIKEGVSHNYYKDKVRLQNKPTIYDSQGKSKYSVLMPVGYYQSFVAAENIPDQQKWYLRAHHVETLTENPLSKKDNIIHTEYQSKLQKIPLKKRPDEYVIEQNVKRKGDLIQSLEERLGSLRKQLDGATRGSRIVEGAKVSPSIINNYFTKLTENKEDKDLQIATFQGVLYDLRRKQRQLLVNYRQNESHIMGEPQQKWWERKDKQFNNQLRKDRLLISDSLKPEHKHREYVDKLKNSQIY